jgi:hypothetical protein
MFSLNISKLSPEEYFSILYNSNKSDGEVMENHLLYYNLIRNNELINKCVESDTIYTITIGFKNGEYRLSSNKLSDVLNAGIVYTLENNFTIFDGGYGLHFNECNLFQCTKNFLETMERLNNKPDFISAEEYAAAIKHKKYWLFTGHRNGEYYCYHAYDVEKLLSHVLNNLV